MKRRKGKNGEKGRAWISSAPLPLCPFSPFFLFSAAFSGSNVLTFNVLTFERLEWYACGGWRRRASAGASVPEEGPDSTTGGMPGNARPWQREGKCRRKQTAPDWPGVRVKGCGKSAPPIRKRMGHGKPHAEQGRIGGPRVACPRIPSRVGEVPGLAARAAR